MKPEHDLYVEKLGLFLHKKFELHLFITIIFNIISFIVVIGVFQQLKYPLVQYESNIGIIIYASINTVILEVIKLFLIRHFMAAIIKTRGAILFLVVMLVYWLTSLLFVEDFHFSKPVLVKLFIFTTMFILMKALLIIALQRVKRKDDENEKHHEEV